MVNRFIDKLSALASFSAKDISALTAATAGARQVPAKQDLIREGDRPGPVFVILEGWSYRYKILRDGTRQILAFMMPGDSCDLHAGLLAEMDHGIQTIVPSVVATIERAEMDALLDRHPSIARAMYVAQLVDQGTLRAWITSMGRRTSVQRAAHLMCELYVRATSIGLPLDGVVRFPISQLLLADALGMTPVHLNRVLKELRERGVMKLSRGNLSITDAAQLVSIAGFDENYLHRRLRTA